MFGGGTHSSVGRALANRSRFDFKCKLSLNLTLVVVAPEIGVDHIFLHIGSGCHLDIEDNELGIQ